MTKEREALKLALAALEYHTVQTRPIAASDAAITAIQAALAQPEAEAHLQAVTDFGQLQAQIEQKPVMEYDKEELRGTFWDTTSPKRNFCSRCGKRLGLESIAHTCTLPRMFDDYGNKIV